MKRELTLLDKFRTSDYEEQFQMLRNPETQAAVREWLGEGAFDELMKHAPGGGHLGTGPRNVIFVPGVMGSTLDSDGLGGVWWLDAVRARDKLDQLRLTLDGTNDANPDAEVIAKGIDVSYVPFRQAVANYGEFGGAIQFPYDWRKSLVLSADSLRDQVIENYQTYNKPVHLVGHSMGGLMIRTALRIHGKKLWPMIGKVVFIGTPHYGSTAIAGYLKNHLWGWEMLAVLAMFLSRETFRSMRGVLSLLPAPAGVYPGTRNGEAHPCANFDLYDAKAWKLDLDEAATLHLQSVLDQVRDFHTELFQFHSTLRKDYRDRMLMIAGVGQETLFRLEFSQAFWGAWKHTTKITERTPCDPNREGDSSVPLASALIEGVTTRYVNGVHGVLQNIPSVARDVLAWLTDKPLQLPETCKGALGGHLAAKEEVAAPLLSQLGLATNRYRELPEYENPSDELRARIAADIDGGRIKLDGVKLL